MSTIPNEVVMLTAIEQEFADTVRLFNETMDYAINPAAHLDATALQNMKVVALLRGRADIAKRIERFIR